MIKLGKRKRTKTPNKQTNKQTNKQNTTKKTKARVTHIPLEIYGGLMPCFTCHTCRDTLVIFSVISHAWERYRIVITTKKNIAGIIGDTDTPLRLASHDGNHKAFDMTTSTLPPGTLGSVASFLAATHCQTMML